VKKKGVNKNPPQHVSSFQKVTPPTFPAGCSGGFLCFSSSLERSYGTLGEIFETRIKPLGLCFFFSKENGPHFFHVGVMDEI